LLKVLAELPRMSSKSTVGPVYKGVIADVLKNVRDKFLNEGVDEQVLQELKQLWETKLQQSRAVDDLEVAGKAAGQQPLVYPHNQVCLQIRVPQYKILILSP
jgi:hypothetical protein